MHFPPRFPVTLFELLDIIWFMYVSDSQLDSVLLQHHRSNSPYVSPEYLKHLFNKVSFAHWDAKPITYWATLMNVYHWMNKWVLEREEEGEGKGNGAPWGKTGNTSFSSFLGLISGVESKQPESLHKARERGCCTSFTNPEQCVPEPTAGHTPTHFFQGYEKLDTS